MVVDFHGWGGNANSQEKDSLFAAVADDDETGYFVLTAEGMSDMNNRKNSWGISAMLFFFQFFVRSTANQTFILNSQHNFMESVLLTTRLQTKSITLIPQLTVKH